MKILYKTSYDMDLVMFMSDTSDMRLHLVQNPRIIEVGEGHYFVFLCAC